MTNDATKGYCRVADYDCLAPPGWGGSGGWAPGDPEGQITDTCDSCGEFSCKKCSQLKYADGLWMCLCNNCAESLEGEDISAPTESCALCDGSITITTLFGEELVKHHNPHCVFGSTAGVLRARWNQVNSAIRHALEMAALTGTADVKTTVIKPDQLADTPEECQT